MNDTHNNLHDRNRLLGDGILVNNNDNNISDQEKRQKPGWNRYSRKEILKETKEKIEKVENIKYHLKSFRELSDKDKKKHKFINLDLKSKYITSFSSNRIKLDATTINLSNNNIVNFEGMKVYSRMISLNLDNNPIRSFKGCVSQPHMKKISMRRSPITRNPYFKLMCVIAFGSQLNTINDDTIYPDLKTQAEKLAKNLRGYLYEGKVLTNIYPLRLIDNEILDDTQERVVLPDKNLLEATQQLVFPTPVIRDSIKDYDRKIQPPAPSVAVILNELLVNERFHEIVRPEISSSVIEIVNKLRVNFPNKEDPSVCDFEEDTGEEDDEDNAGKFSAEIDHNYNINADSPVTTTNFHFSNLRPSARSNDSNHNTLNGTNIQRGISNLTSFSVVKGSEEEEKEDHMSKASSKKSRHNSFSMESHQDEEEEEEYFEDSIYNMAKKSNMPGPSTYSKEKASLVEEEEGEDQLKKNLVANISSQRMRDSVSKGQNSSVLSKSNIVEEEEEEEEYVGESHMSSIIKDGASAAKTSVASSKYTEEESGEEDDGEEEE